MRYRETGVNLDQQDQFIELVKRLNHLSGDQIGPFAAIYDLTEILKSYKHPVLVSSTDGIGTKTRLAVKYGSVRGLGQDLVAMSVNDIATIGAQPLFFLDYYGAAQLDLRLAEDFIKGLVEACEQAGCPLIGGETSQLGDLYRNEFDLEFVGFVVGVTERAKLPDPARVSPGDQLIGLPSSGPHCNGYSLIRRIIAERKLDLHKIYPEAGERPLGELLLAPMRIYSGLARELFARFDVKGAAHITGSGIPGNLPRALNDKFDAVLKVGAWPRPKIFDALQRWGAIPDDEMWAVFNIGLGFIVILSKVQAGDAMKFLEKQGERAYFVGEIARGAGKVVLS
jgi:phosphoribosylformylglycinamidine cyclo-ligase